MAIELKEYKDSRRFFFLYEFYESRHHSKRLIVDYIIGSKQFVFIDWSETKNSWRYSAIEWDQVEDDSAVLALYPSYYSPEKTYEEIIVRKAVLTKIKQHEIAVRTGSESQLRVAYKQPDTEQVIILSETLTTIGNPTEE